MKYIKTKKVFDIVLVILSLPLAIAILLVILPVSYIVFNKRPFFKQSRIGKNELKFYIFKLKTMYDKFDKDGKVLPDDLRTSGWGDLLRRYSLDEIPQLWNVLRGDLSLVGPRPLPFEYLSYLTKKERMRHTVLPGMTGLAQVNGRNRIDWNVKFQWDLLYVNESSIRLDFAIIFRTIWQLWYSSNNTRAYSIKIVRREQKF